MKIQMERFTMEAQTAYQLYDAGDEELLLTTDHDEIKAYIRTNRPDGYSVWDGTINEEGEFEANRRIEFMHERPDDPRVAEALGFHTPEDTPSLDAPWWRTR
jgi:hypothetical protein